MSTSDDIPSRTDRPGSWRGLHTASAASSVQEPANTARRRNRRFSASVSSSWLQSIAWRSVCCRTGRSGPPPVSRASRRSRRPSICAGERMRIRAAASSMASGSPSRRAQISAISGGVVGGQREGRLPRRGLADEQRDGRIARQRVERRQPRHVRHRQRPYRDALLAGHVQDGLAGDEQRQRRRRLDQVDEQRRRREQLLEVVEHQQRALADRGADVGAQGLGDRTAFDARQPERLGQRRRDVGGVGQRAEADERHAAGEIGVGLRRDLQRQARLAAPARPGQRQHAGAPAAQDAEDRGHLGVAPDQGRARDGQRRGGRVARLAARRPRPVRPGGGRVRRRRHRHLAEVRQVAAGRHVDREAVRVPRGRVVLLQLRAETPRLDPHDGVGARIEALTAPEDLDPDGVFLQRVGPAGQRLVDDVGEEAAQAVRLREALAVEHAACVRPHPLRVEGCLRPLLRLCHGPPSFTAP